MIYSFIILDLHIFHLLIFGFFLVDLLVPFLLFSLALLGLGVLLLLVRLLLGCLPAALGFLKSFSLLHIKFYLGLPSVLGIYVIHK